MLAHDKEVFLVNKIVKVVWLVRALTTGPRRHSDRSRVPVGQGSCRRNFRIGKIEFSCLLTL